MSCSSPGRHHRSPSLTSSNTNLVKSLIRCNTPCHQKITYRKIVLVFSVVANGLDGFVILQVPSLPNLVEIQTSLIGMGRALLLCRFRVLATCVDSKEGEWSLVADNLKAFVGSRLMQCTRYKQDGSKQYHWGSQAIYNLFSVAQRTPWPTVDHDGQFARSRGSVT